MTVSERWSSGRRRHIGNVVWGNSPRVRIPLSPPFFFAKNGERRRKSSLHAATAALHSKGAAFSSHLHKNREALLVKTLHFIPLVKSFRCAPLVKFSPCGSKDGVPLLKRFAYTAASRLDFSFSNAILNSEMRSSYG